MAEQPSQSPFLLRLPEVKARVGLSRSSIYALIAEGSFPAPVPLSARAVAWNSISVDTWIAERIAAAGQTDRRRHTNVAADA